MRSLFVVFVVSLTCCMLVLYRIPSCLADKITEEQAWLQDAERRIQYKCCVLGGKGPACDELHLKKKCDGEKWDQLKKALKQVTEVENKKYTIAEQMQITGIGEVDMWMALSKSKTAKKPDWEDSPAAPAQVDLDAIDKDLPKPIMGGGKELSKLKLLEETSASQLHDSQHERHHISKSKLKQRLAQHADNPYVDAIHLHPGARIKYGWGTSVTDDAVRAPLYKTAVWNAMRKWEDGTCISFIENEDRDYLYNDWAKFEMIQTRAAFSRFVGYTAPADFFAEPLMGISMWRDGISESIAAHELGHLIGLYHTNSRSDRNTYVSYNFRRCYDDYIKGTNKAACGPAQISETQRQLCAQNNARNALMNHNNEWLRVSLKDGYDSTKEVDRRLCEKQLCAKAWQYQYWIREENIHPNTYDYGSIMHYSLDGCLVGKTAAQGGAYDAQNPEKQPSWRGGPTSFDLQTVNNMYNCQSIRITWNGVTSTVYFNPQETVIRVLIKFLRNNNLQPNVVANNNLQAQAIPNVNPLLAQPAVIFPKQNQMNVVVGGITLGVGRGIDLILAP